MHPLLIEGSRLFGPALVAAARSIPPSQLARVGLLRGPLVGAGPAVGAFVVGAAATALLVPTSRTWLVGHVRQALQLAKEWGGKEWAARPWAERPSGHEAECA